jgi:hypothetical protein
MHSYTLRYTVSDSEVTCSASFLLQRAATISRVTQVVLDTVNGFTVTSRMIHRIPWSKECMWAIPYQINIPMRDFQPEQDRTKYLNWQWQRCVKLGKKLFQILSMKHHGIQQTVIQPITTAERKPPKYKNTRSKFSLSAQKLQHQEKWINEYPAFIYMIQKAKNLEIHLQLLEIQ